MNCVDLQQSKQDWAEGLNLALGSLFQCQVKWEEVWVLGKAWSLVEESSRRKRGLSLGRYHWDMFHSVTQSFPWFALRACEGLEEEYAYYYLNKCIAVCLLPRWRSGEESTCQCRRHSRHGFNPWVGKIPWRGKWQATPVFLPGKSHGQRSLMGYSPWGCTESDTTEQLSTHTCTYDSMLMEKWAVI